MNLTELNNLWLSLPSMQKRIETKIEKTAKEEERKYAQNKEALKQAEKKVQELEQEIVRYRATKPKAPRPYRDLSALAELKSFCLESLGTDEALRLEQEGWPAPSKANFRCISHRQRKQYTDLRIKGLGLASVYEHNQKIEEEWMPGLNELLRKEQEAISNVKYFEALVSSTNLDRRDLVLKEFMFKQMDFRNEYRQRYDFDLCADEPWDRELFNALVSLNVPFKYQESVDWRASWGLFSSISGYEHKVEYWTKIEDGPLLHFSSAYGEEQDIDEDDDEDDDEE